MSIRERHQIVKKYTAILCEVLPGSFVYNDMRRVENGRVYYTITPGKFAYILWPDTMTLEMHEVDPTGEPHSFRMVNAMIQLAKVDFGR
jgi:hypothetical protein